jgi:hypothetical protein
MDHQTNRLVQIGNICQQWSFLEYLYALTIWQLLGIDQETGKFVTGGTDIQPRMKLAVNLSKHLNAPKRLTKALEMARDSLRDAKLDERRNKAIHGVRFIGARSEAASLIEVHRGRGGRIRHEQKDAELAAIGKDLNVISSQLLSELTAVGILDRPVFKPAKYVARKAP